jgi:chromosome partitioning protein
MKRVVFNQKGGVGKTSITCNLAAVSASTGKRTVVLDLDPQYNSSHYLLGDTEANDGDIADYLDQAGGIFSPSKNISEFVYETPFENLFIIPASSRLPEIEHKLESRYKIFKLREALNELSENFDEIYIDTPPAFNFFTKSALIGCDRVLIPFDCDTFSRQSLDKVSEAILDICSDHNPDLMIEGVVVNQFQPRAKLPKQLVDDLRDSGYPILPVMLTSSVKMRESHHHAKPLIYFAPSHPLTEQFKALHTAIVDGVALARDTRLEPAK